MRKVTERLRALLDEGHRLSEEHPPRVRLDGPRDQPGLTLHRREQKWVMDCRTVLNFAQLPDHAKCFRATTSMANRRVVGVSDRRLAALESAVSLIEGGFVGNVRHLVHADIFDSLIDQATALLAEGHNIPAAVLGRIVIERWLRDKAEATGIAEHGTAKASKLNDDLKKAGTHSKPKWQLIQAHLAVGNAAAHGKEDECPADDVRQLLEWARANCL